MILPPVPQAPPPAEWPLTRAERSGYTETTRYPEVISFLDFLKSRSTSLRIETFGKSAEGRGLPLAILGWNGESPVKPSRGIARESGVPSGASSARRKPVVFVLANIHAGEVEGKEAALQLLRDGARGELGGLLGKIVLLVAPIYNADGNERIDIRNRSAQNGPSGGVGIRENTQGLDLNRDFIKAEAPETRALIEGVFKRWDPDLTVDLHTTNGSYHGYHLTYAAPMHPNTNPGLIRFLRESLLADVTKRLATKGWRTGYYGNFEGGTREKPEFWATFDYRPRFGTNAIGLRNRMAILSEAYSYLDFRTRTAATGAFVREVLQFVARHPAEIRRLVRQADSQSRRLFSKLSALCVSADMDPSKEPVEVLKGSVARVTDPATGLTRLVAGEDHHPVPLRLKQTFRPAKRLSAPAGYLVPLGEETARLLELLALHGIHWQCVEEDGEGEGAEFAVESVRFAERPFQNHREATVEGAWRVKQVAWRAGEQAWVPMDQPLAPLVFQLLEPESTDGAATWNFFDEPLRAGRWPLCRLNGKPGRPRTRDAELP